MPPRHPTATYSPATVFGVKKELVRDLIPDLTSTGGYVLDKVEGLAIFEDGSAIFSTDNDGVDDHSGETIFMNIGNIESRNF